MQNPQALNYESHYHIFNRGNNRENIFFEERNYAYFLKLYADIIEPVAETFAYCLLKNHFHLLVYIKSEEKILAFNPSSNKIIHTPSQQFSNFFNAYAKAINKAYQRTGSLLQHPFGRIEITSNAHFARLVTYIHQNPQEHGLVSDFRSWPYSSYRTILSDQPTRLNRDEVLQWFNGQKGFIECHKMPIQDDQILNWAPNDF
jgi:putative transposase